MAKKSLFIVIEGLDGSGKTSVSRRLMEVLQQRHQASVKLTYEPHDPSCGGLYIRQVLMKKITDFEPRVLALSFAANRLDHCAREIDPWLAGGESNVVICDRYYLSSLVYQSLPDFPLEKVMALNEKARKPDIIFFLNVSNEVCYARLKKRNQPEELFEKDMDETRDKFLKAISFLKKNDHENIHEIDSNGTIESVVKQMMTIIENEENWSSIDEETTTLPSGAKESVTEGQVNSFLELVKSQQVKVGRKLLSEFEHAYELEYNLPGRLHLRGVAIAVAGEQKVDSILSAGNAFSAIADFIFVFVPGQPQAVIDYYEREKMAVKETGTQRMFPVVKIFTEKDIAATPNA